MKIAMYDLEGNFLELFENLETVRELEEALNYGLNTINNVLNGSAHQSKGRQFLKFSNLSKYPRSVGDVRGLNTGLSYDPIGKYYKGRFICSYKSLRDASESNGINSVNIIQCCDGKTKTSHGYTFKRM